MSAPDTHLIEEVTLWTDPFGLLHHEAQTVELEQAESSEVRDREPSPEELG